MQKIFDFSVISLQVQCLNLCASSTSLNIDSETFEALIYIKLLDEMNLVDEAYEKNYFFFNIEKREMEPEKFLKLLKDIEKNNIEID